MDHVAINILGLSVGMAAGLMIILYIQDEISYDRFHEKADRIFRLEEYARVYNRPVESAATPAPWGPALADELPEVENMVRFRKTVSAWLIQYEEQRFYDTGVFIADSTVFDIFSFPFLEGDPATALTNPKSIVLTASMAKRLGGDNIMGRSIMADRWSFTVTGIMADPPANAHFHPSCMISYATLPAVGLFDEPATFQESGFNHSVYTYLLLKPGVSSETIDRKLPGFIDRHMGEQLKSRGITVNPYLKPLTAIHLQSDLIGEIEVNGNADTVYLLMALTIVILLIAGSNYVNLATANAIRRAQEISVRKAFGATRVMLIRQFLGESVLATVISGVICLSLVYLGLDRFNVIMDKQISLSALGPAGWAILIFGLLLVGIAAGIYPAFYLSKYPSGSNRQMPLKISNGRLRKGLVVFQFTLAIMLITTALTVFDQLTFMTSTPTGMQTEDTMVIQLKNSSTLRRLPAFKNAVKQIPEVIAVTSASQVPGEDLRMMTVRIDGEDVDAAYPFLIVAPGFLETMGVNLVAGLHFSALADPDRQNACIINETMARELGGLSALERVITSSAGGAYRVIGVADDFHFRTLHYKIEPMLMVGNPIAPNIFIKVHGGYREHAVDRVGRVWREIYPEYPALEYEWLDDSLYRRYGEESRLIDLLWAASCLAVIIACLGIFSLTSFITEQSVREIGIRKVLGATVFQIGRMYLRRFLMLVLVAGVFSVPLSVIGIQRWLENYAYHTDLSFWNPALAFLVTSALVAVTIMHHIRLASKLNPTVSLREE